MPGVWSAKHCETVGQDGACSAFYLYLTQKDGRVCGSHYVATQGASRVDEGDPGTVLGTVSGEAALLMIKSTRNNAWHMARVNANAGALEWRLVGTVIAGDDDEPTIVPWSEKLLRDVSAEQIKRLKEIESAPCQWPDESKEQNDAH